MARLFFLLGILMALWVLPTYAMPLSELSQAELRRPWARAGPSA